MIWLFNKPIISVNGLSFKRFLDITKLLNISPVVVTDNDNDYEKI
jgi:putative ATP-dependent endonuclease of the OLD family